MPSRSIWEPEKTKSMTASWMGGLLRCLTLAMCTPVVSGILVYVGRERQYPRRKTGPTTRTGGIKSLDRWPKLIPALQRYTHREPVLGRNGVRCTSQHRRSDVQVKRV